MGTSRLSRQTMLFHGSHVLVLLWTQLLIPSQAQYRGADLDRWGEWSAWSPCSSTCGPGLETRSRQCGADLADRRGGSSVSGSGCRGLSTQKKACDITACPSERPTAHEVACSRYNSRTFSGRRYVWEPFTHPPSPCKLACRARGQHFYANLAGTVQDGTPCKRGAVEAICDGGECKRVGCDGVIGSSVARDNCGVCRGDGSTCTTIAGIFISTSLRRGLNDVISIPAGSTNINITELEPSRNLLLLQTFEGRTILNGGTRSPVAGQVTEAGTVFTYSTKTRANRRGSIFAPGPTNVGIKLKLLLRGRNPGIKYTFNVGSKKGATTLQQINRSSQRAQVHTRDDAIRDRLGVSGFEAGPDKSYVQKQEREEPKTTADADDDSDKDFDSGDDVTPSGQEDQTDSDMDSEDGDSTYEEEGSEESLEVSERDTDDEDEEEYGDDEDGEYDENEDEDEEEGEYDENDEEDEEEDEDVEEADRDDDEKDETDEDTGDETRARLESRRGQAYKRKYISNTLSDERSSSGSDDDYRIPKYSQSFSFGKRYKSEQGDNVQRTTFNRRPTTYGETKRPGRVVSFGLKYVDDKNGNANSETQTVTVGSVTNVANSRQTPATSYISPSRSDNANARRGSTTQEGIRRSYQPRSRVIARTHRRTQQPHRGSQSAANTWRDNSRRRELLRRQRQRERERELYNQRIREYKERARRREAQLARRRRLERERYQSAYSRQRYNTVSQSRPRSSWRSQNLPERETSTGSRNGNGKLDLQKPSKQSTRGTIVRHYGEDGLYASGQDVKEAGSPPDSVEIFKPRNNLPQTDKDGRSESRPTVLTNTRRASESSSGQPSIISRVRAPTKQDKPEIISRVAQPEQRPTRRIISRVAQPVEPPKSAIISRVAKPVEQRRPDIIPRVRTTGPLENTGGRRPSVISALSGGDVPAQETRDFVGDIIPNSSPVRPQAVRPLQTVDRAIEAGRGPGDASYIWRISGFTECTLTCGGGVQQTVVVCVDTTTQAVVTDENCQYVQRPALTAVKCNTRPCPAEWTAGPWTACSASCGGGEKTRTLTCQSRVSPTLNLTVSNSSCEGKQHPPQRERCGLDPCNSWRTGNWSQCSARCGEGIRTRPVECVSLAGDVLADDACSNSIRPRPDVPCDNGPCGKGWFYQEWPEECPVECGEGEMTRKIFCSGESNEVLPDERCDPDQRPDIRRKCRSTRPCGGQWFTGPWSKCAGSCGPGKKSRDVICIKSLSGKIFASVDEENCLASEKPADSEACEREPCRPEWYMTSWSQCSKSCGTGYKTRGVKCLSPEQTASDQCPLSARPKIRNSCNKQGCNKITTNETSGPEPSDGCVDTLPGCAVVKKARMCRYLYYKKKCCESCSKE